MREHSLRRPNSTKVPLLKRFSAKYFVDDKTGCWLWTACKHRQGYGMIKVNRKMEMSHRVSWELQNGPIPKGEGYHGTCVLHKCDTPACVNPSHLFLGTNADNAADMVSKGRHKAGEKMSNSKLKEADVLLIRDDPRPGRFLAKVYGVSPSLIWSVKRRTCWVHL